MGLKDEAKQALQPITPGMDVIENGAYYRLLLYYKGRAAGISPDGQRASTR